MNISEEIRNKFQLPPHEEEMTADVIREASKKYISEDHPIVELYFMGIFMVCDLGINYYAIDCFTKVIAMEPDNMKAYGYRGRAYLQQDDIDNARQDFNAVIESGSKVEELGHAYLGRSIIGKIRSDEPVAISDFAKAIELGLKESEAFAYRAAIYKKRRDYRLAVDEYTSAINLDQTNPALYSERARTYWNLRNEGVNALEDFAKSIDLGLAKDSVTVFLEGPLHEISNIFLSGGEDEMFPRDFPLKARLIELYNNIVDKYPDLAAGYLHRGIYLMTRNDYGNALTDLSSYLHLKNNDVFIIFLQGVCYGKLKEEGKARENFQQIIRQGAIDNIKKITKKLAEYPPIDNEIDFTLFMSEIGRICTIEETLLALVNLFYIHNANHQVFLNEERLDLARYLDSLQSDPDSVSHNLPGKVVDDVFCHYPDYKGSVIGVLKRDGWDDFAIYAKLSLIEDILSGVDVREWGEFDACTPYDSANGSWYKLHEGYLNRYINLINWKAQFSKQIQLRTIEIKAQEKERMLRAESKARLDERDKVIADLSHSIKNLIATVIDPLENMQQERVGEPQIIGNALRGANLVREIVNAMNLSFKGSLDDFNYDAAHSRGKDSMDLESIVLGSLKYSVGNMFDDKYFSTFVHKYFPTRDIFNEAKSAWVSISQTSHRQDLMGFLEKYFFHIEVSTGIGNQYALGNEKGSAIKLLILFQELIFNAVKYSSFVAKEIRFIKVYLNINQDQIAIYVANRFRENLAMKTSGIGHIIIDNFAKLLEAQPVVSQKDGVYSVYIEFTNLWEERNENFICGG